MSETNANFWNIMEASFPTAIGDRLLEEQERERVHYEKETSERELRKPWISAASYDERIADYFLHGIGDEESLTAGLQRDYILSKEEAVESIDMGVGHFSDVADFGDEEYPSANAW